MLIEARRAPANQPKTLRPQLLTSVCVYINTEPDALQAEIYGDIYIYIHTHRRRHPTSENPLGQGLLRLCEPFPSREKHVHEDPRMELGFGFRA